MSEHCSICQRRRRKQREREHERERERSRRWRGANDIYDVPQFPTHLINQAQQKPEEIVPQYVVDEMPETSTTMPAITQSPSSSTVSVAPQHEQAICYSPQPQTTVTEYYDDNGTHYYSYKSTSMSISCNRKNCKACEQLFKRN